MPKLYDESLLWLDNLARITAQKAKTPKATHDQLATALDLPRSMVTFLSAINDCFDETAIQKVRQAEKTTPTFTLSFNSAYALSRLGRKAKTEDLHSLVHAALDVILVQRLVTLQIKALVTWMASGKPAAEFDPKAKLPKKGSKKGKTEEETGEDFDNPGKTSLDLKKIRQMLEKAEAERIRGSETIEQEKLAAYLQKLFGSSPSKTSKADSLAGEVISETILLDWLADIPVLARIKTKRKKGKPLSTGEWCLLAAHKIGGLFGHLCKFLLKPAKPLLKLLHVIWKLVVDALKELGLYRYAKAIFTLVALAAAIWFAWQAFHYGVMRPMEMIWSKIHVKTTAESPAEQEPPPPTTVRNEELGSSKLKTPNS